MKNFPVSDDNLLDILIIGGRPNRSKFTLDIKGKLDNAAGDKFDYTVEDLEITRNGSLVVQVTKSIEELIAGN